MTYRTTIGWSLLSSGIVTLFLEAIPIPSLFLGILLVILGIVVLVWRQT